MSFPNIPDITPDISVTFDDAINLLLISIALEEISLSKLIDAEKDKILFVLDECKHKDSALHDALAINKSVDSTIKNMIKLQMLLQFKLENVTELIPTTTTTTTTTTSTTSTTTTTRTTTTKTTSTTTTHTTTSTTSTCSTTTKKECECSVIGRGRGCVSNKCDEFYGETAALQVFIFSCDYNNRSVRYSVENDAYFLKFSSSTNIEIECPNSKHPDIIIIHGKGYVRKKVKCQPEIFGNVNFTLKVWNNTLGKRQIEMKITSDYKPELNHNSGLVKLKCSDLKIESF